MSAQARNDAQVKGKWLLLSRTAWFLVVGLGIVLNIIGIPLHYAQWTTTCSGPSCASFQPTPQQAQQFHQLGLSLDFWASFLIWCWLLPPLVSLVVAAIIFRRRSGDRMVLFTSFVLVAYEFGLSLDYQSTSLILQALTYFYSGLGNIALTLYIFVFPDGRFVPKWANWVALAGIVLMVVGNIFPNDSIFNNLTDVAPLLGVLFQIYRYVRVSNTVQRQQTKWVVFSFTVSEIIGAVLGLYFTSIVTLQTASPIAGILSVSLLTIGLILVPVSFGVAIMRYRLYDIDVIIRRTLIYGALTAMLGLTYWGGVAALQALLRPITGEGNDLAIVATTLVVAGLFFPLRARIQGFIDRRFYRRKYDASRTLAAFGQVARDEVDLDALKGHLVQVVGDTMQPEHISLWLAKE